MRESKYKSLQAIFCMLLLLFNIPFAIAASGHTIDASLTPTDSKPGVLKEYTLHVTALDKKVTKVILKKS